MQRRGLPVSGTLSADVEVQPPGRLTEVGKIVCAQAGVIGDGHVFRSQLTDSDGLCYFQESVVVRQRRIAVAEFHIAGRAGGFADAPADGRHLLLDVISEIHIQNPDDTRHLCFRGDDVLLGAAVHLTHGNQRGRRRIQSACDDRLQCQHDLAGRDQRIYAGVRMRAVAGLSVNGNKEFC